MKTSEVIEKTTCDFCNKQIVSENNYEINIGGNDYDLCSECYKRLSYVMNWNKYKNKEISINMNLGVSVCLGEDGANSYNKHYAFNGVCEHPTKAGEWLHSQIWSFLGACADSFKKQCGSYQSIAHPFEMRFKISDFNFVEEEKEYNETNI